MIDYFNMLFSHKKVNVNQYRSRKREDSNKIYKLIKLLESEYPITIHWNDYLKVIIINEEYSPVGSLEIEYNKKNNLKTIIINGNAYHDLLTKNELENINELIENRIIKSKQKFKYLLL